MWPEWWTTMSQNTKKSSTKHGKNPKEMLHAKVETSFTFFLLKTKKMKTLFKNAKKKLGKTRGMEHVARATMTPSELVSMFFQTCEVQCEFPRLSSRVVLMEGQTHTVSTTTCSQRAFLIFHSRSNLCAQFAFQPVSLRVFETSHRSLVSNPSVFLERKKSRVLARLPEDVATDTFTLYEHHIQLTLSILAHSCGCCIDVHLFHRLWAQSPQ